MSDVTLCECFARDGLQHEPAFVPTGVKRALVERFAALGFPRVEATSYSSPKVVPQFADFGPEWSGRPVRDAIVPVAEEMQKRADPRKNTSMPVGYRKKMVGVFCRRLLDDLVEGRTVDAE